MLKWQKKNNLLTIEKSEGERMTGRKKVTRHFMIPLYLRESHMSNNIKKKRSSFAWKNYYYSLYVLYFK